MTVRTTRMLLALALVLLGVAGQQAWRLARIHESNSLITARRATDAPPDAPAEVRFAAAAELAGHGQVQAALDRYRELETSPDLQLRTDARFNSANLYFQQALAARTGADPSRSLALMELAKQSYRELLRERSDDWDARYNLERALRVAPDPEQEAEGLPPPPGARRAPTALRGSNLGLP